MKILMLLLASAVCVQASNNGRFDFIPQDVPLVLVAYNKEFDSQADIRRGQGIANKAGSYYAATDSHDTVIFQAGKEGGGPAALLGKLGEIKASGRMIRRLLLMGHGREGYSTVLDSESIDSFAGQGFEEVFIPGAEVIFFSCNVAGFGDGEHGPDDGKDGRRFLRRLAKTFLAKNGGRVVAPKGYFYDWVDQESAKLNPMHADKLKTFAVDGAFAQFVVAPGGAITEGQAPAKKFLELYHASVEAEGRAWEWRGRGCAVVDPIHVTGPAGIKAVREAIGRCAAPGAPKLIQRAAERGDAALDEAGYRLSK